MCVACHVSFWPNSLKSISDVSSSALSAAFIIIKAAQLTVTHVKVVPDWHSMPSWALIAILRNRKRVARATVSTARLHLPVVFFFFFPHTKSTVARGWSMGTRRGPIIKTWHSRQSMLCLLFTHRNLCLHRRLREASRTVSCDWLSEEVINIIGGRKEHLWHPN